MDFPVVALRATWRSMRHSSCFLLCLMRFAAPFAMLAIAGQTLAADLRRGEQIFKQCASCHTLQTNSNGFGPTLNGVIGRNAGTVPNFRYSPAMTEAGAKGLVWDEAALSEFLRSPKTKVPGTSMRFWGFWFQSEIDDVVAYIKANQ